MRTVLLQTVMETDSAGGQIGKVDLSAGDFQVSLSMGLGVQAKNIEQNYIYDMLYESKGYCAY